MISHQMFHLEEGDKVTCRPDNDEIVIGDLRIFPADAVSAGRIAVAFAELSSAMARREVKTEVVA